MTFVASCHCGGTRIVLPKHPTKAARCNCTFCQRTGAVWAYYAIGEIEVTERNGQQNYSSDPRLGSHHFCGTCGIHTWGESVDWSTVYDESGALKSDAPLDMTACQVNLNLVDGLDWSKIEIENLDGRNAW